LHLQGNGWTTGKFLKGNKGGGRLPKAPKSLVAALKERLDPDELADELIKRSKTSDAILMYVYNRIEGMPRQSAEVEHTGSVDLKLKWQDGDDA
jgi:hypothetical protein